MKLLSYLQRLLSQCLIMLCTFQQQPLLHFWLRVICLIIFIPFSILGIAADQIYLKGLTQRNLIKLEAARLIFPYEREINIGPAQLNFINRKIDQNALQTYKDALYYDSYSIQFLGVVTQIEFLIGNKNEALIYKQKLEKIGPNSNILKTINEFTKGLK